MPNIWSRIVSPFLPPSARAAKPHAVFEAVPRARWPVVDAHVRAQVKKAVGARCTPDIDKLLVKVGAGDFYDVVATVDPAHAADWQEMGRVQRSFARAEPDWDSKTRAYSESMRVTLHAALLQHLADPSLRVQGKDTRDLFEMFLELHVTAFHENGAWVDNMQIPLGGALEVVEATPFEMVMNADELLEGNWLSDAATVRAAQWVREGRRAALADGRGPRAEGEGR